MTSCSVRSATGIGIPANMLEHIFDMFSQVDTSVERTQGGLGIGLMLVKSLVKLHGGSVKAFSGGLGEGALFIVRLPLAEASDIPKEVPVAPPAPASAALPRRILIVEDNVLSAKTLGWMIETLGSHEIKLAHNGADAIALAKSFIPDIVLLDIGLPGMSGYDVCRALRKEPLLKNVMIAAQTGWGQKEARDKSQEAGFDHHLVKPVDLSTLKKLLESPKAPIRQRG